MNDEVMTTAKTLGKFYAELLAASVPAEIAADITRSAGNALIHDEATLIVRDAR